MSCHDIGRGMNEVVRMTISLYDKGEISRESATKIIATCEVAVNWCDGNGGEAIDYISRCRCGRCLKLVPKGEHLYYLPGLNYSFFKGYRDSMEDARLASYGVCDDCFVGVMADLGYDADEAEKARQELLSCESSDYYESTGEMSDTNCGCRWVRDTDWYDKKTDKEN